MTSIVPRSIVTLIVLLLIAASASTLPSTASAAPRWVNDEIRITFRSGPGDAFRIIRYLTTGARLETATPPADRFPDGNPDGWTYLSDAAGNTGWVRDQYLAGQPPARVRIDAVLAERDSARGRVSALTAELAATRGQLAEASQQLTDGESRIAELETRFAAARSGYELVETNQALEQTVGELRERNDALRRENQDLADRSLKEWFLIGAGVLGAGIIMGLILPSLRRKKNPWGSGGL